MGAQISPEGIARSRANLLNGRKPHLANRLLLLRDAAELETLVMDCCRKKRNNAESLSALVRVFCSLVPLIRALQGKTLFVSGTMSRKADPSPADALKQLRKAKGQILDISSQLSDAPDSTGESKESLKT